MTADTLNQTRQAEQERQHRLKDRILCCTVAGCLSAGGQAVRTALQEAAAGKSRFAELGAWGSAAADPWFAVPPWTLSTPR
jgi:hypothetical protein